MLRFTDGASIDFTLDPWREPPRPPVEPFPRRDSHARTFDGTGVASEVITDLGADPTRVVRFASSESVGFVTRAEAEDLITLFNAAAGFTIETDLLGIPGAAAVLYDAWFDPGVVPQFTYPTIQKDLLLMDVVVRIKPQ